MCSGVSIVKQPMVVALLAVGVIAITTSKAAAQPFEVQSESGVLLFQVERGEELSFKTALASLELAVKTAIPNARWESHTAAESIDTNRVQILTR